MVIINLKLYIKKRNLKSKIRKIEKKIDCYKSLFIKDEKYYLSLTINPINNKERALKHTVKEYPNIKHSNPHLWELLDQIGFKNISDSNYTCHMGDTKCHVIFAKCAEYNHNKFIFIEKLYLGHVPTHATIFEEGRFIKKQVGNKATVVLVPQNQFSSNSSLLEGLSSEYLMWDMNIINQLEYIAWGNHEIIKMNKEVTKLLDELKHLP